MSLKLSASSLGGGRLKELQLRKKRGVRFGAKPKEKTDEYAVARNRWQRGEISAREAARQIEVSHTTFLRWARLDID